VFTKQILWEIFRHRSFRWKLPYVNIFGSLKNTFGSLKPTIDRHRNFSPQGIGMFHAQWNQCARGGNGMSSYRKRSRLRAEAAGFVAILTLLLISTSAIAQSDSSPPWDLFLGYQWLHPGITVPAPFGNPASPTGYDVPDMAAGFGVALTYNFDPHWGGEIDFGQNWGSSNYETTISGGPRVMFRTDTANYFVHGLLSYNRLSINGLNTGQNGVGLIAGGGMDLPLTKKFAWRVFEADYVFGTHNYASEAGPQFPDLRRPSAQGVRLRTGVVFSWAGAPAPIPSASCSVQPTEVMVGEPITATVSTGNFNPKHSLAYAWSGNGGQVTGNGTTASVDTTNVAPGSYTLTAHVSDPKEKKNPEASCSANYTIQPLPPKNPPTMSLSASPTELVTGGTVNLTASCSSPDKVSTSVANWTSTAGTVSGSGSSASLDTTGLPPGAVTVTATCRDSRGLTGQGSTEITVQSPPPPPPVNKTLEARLALHSVYFPTNMPPVTDPNAGLIASQRRTLETLATDFKSYVQARPDAHLVLEGHADTRGSDAFNQALSERRVARLKRFLVEQGIPEADIETKAYGKQHNLTTAEVADSIQHSPDLTTEERKRALSRIGVIKLASNRRVDITLKSEGQSQTSVRQFPFNSADALTLIGGRESEMKKPATGARQPMKKPTQKP
jgi:outer membrane protein OmpA-like peptidoglycan-associated protein